MDCYFFFQAEDGIRDAQELVGSEMCIRDSNSGPPAELSARGAEAPQRCACQQVQVDLEHGLACLLYTSDAADDLLCVDLGGRRIIKKKNTAKDLHTHPQRSEHTH